MTDTFLHAGLVVVTGAGSGIGRATTRALAADGHPVLMVDISGTALGDAAEEVTAAVPSSALQTLEGDVADPHLPERVLGAAADRVTGLVNCAAVAPRGALQETTADDLDACFRVNVRGALLLMQAVAASMQAQGSRGSIVNVASVDGIVGDLGVLAYCMSKGALVNASRAAALDLAAAGIRVNVVCPGMVDTPFLGLSRDQIDHPRSIVRRQPNGLVQPDEVADVVTFLLSGRARAVNGAVLAVDNGLSAGWHYSIAEAS